MWAAELGSNLCRNHPRPQVPGPFRLLGYRVRNKQGTPRDQVLWPKCWELWLTGSNTESGEREKDRCLDLRGQCTAYKSGLLRGLQERPQQEVNVLRPKSTPTSRQRSIIQHLKEMSSRATKGHGRTLNAYY